MKLQLLLTTLLCFLLINPIHQQELESQLEGRFISWDIAKLEYIQRKLIIIRDLLINALTSLTQLELALLQAIIDALRRLQGTRTLIVNKESEIKDEDIIKFLEYCNDLIKRYEKIQEDKKSKQVDLQTL